MNNIFYFIEIYSLTNYVDANTLDMVANTLELMMNILKQDTQNAINFVVNNFMPINASKFQFLFSTLPR